MENDDELEKIGDSILDQLQQSLTVKSSKPKDEPLTTNNLEEFVLNKTATLVVQSMEAVDNLKDYIQAGVSDKEIAAFAEMVKASTAAVETLNKLLQSRDKIAAAKKLKEMDIEARKEMNTQDNQTRLLLNREEIIKQLITKEPEIIDVTPINSEQN